MTNRHKGTAGIILILAALVIGIVDRMTQIISTLLGQFLYGERYLEPVNGILGDSSYGFNTDMHLSFSLIVVLILGILLYISSKQKSSVNI